MEPRTLHSMLSLQRERESEEAASILALHKNTFALTDLLKGPWGLQVPWGIAQQWPRWCLSLGEICGVTKHYIQVNLQTCHVRKMKLSFPAVEDAAIWGLLSPVEKCSPKRHTLLGGWEGCTLGWWPYSSDFSLPGANNNTCILMQFKKNFLKTKIFRKTLLLCQFLGKKHHLTLTYTMRRGIKEKSKPWFIL